MRKSKGFTLIELLTVISIISFLMSFFLVALKRYKNEARDASIKSLLAETRNMAEIHRDSFQTYIGICEADGTLSGSGNLGIIESSIAGSGGSVFCNADLNAFAVISTLNNGGCWCIDSTSNAGRVELDSGESCPSQITENNCPL